MDYSDFFCSKPFGIASLCPSVSPRNQSSHLPQRRKIQRWYPLQQIGS